MLLCLTAPGRATISRVTPMDPIGHVEVVRFAVRPNPLIATPPADTLGSDFGSLADGGFTTNATVDQACGDDKHGYGSELGLELVVPADENAVAHGWRIDYQADGDAGSTTFPLTVVLCSTPDADADAPACHTLENPGRARLIVG